MHHLPGTRRSAIIIALLGIAFLAMGISRRAQGGSAAFMIIGFGFIALGLRRYRHAQPGPVA